MAKTLLVYGTLRQKTDRNYNFGRFGAQVLLGDMWLNGYMMMNLGSYPAAVKGLGQIFCEIHQVSDKTFEHITRMEEGAGYDTHEHELDIVGIGKVTASMYAMPKAIIDHYRGVNRIRSGDWNDREAIG